MADLTPKTISELPSASSLTDSDLVPISQGGYSKKTLWSTIRTTLAAAFFPLAIANGGTGATTSRIALANLGVTIPDGWSIEFSIYGEFRIDFVNGDNRYRLAWSGAGISYTYYENGVWTEVWTK